MWRNNFHMLCNNVACLFLGERSSDSCLSIHPPHVPQGFCFVLTVFNFELLSKFVGSSFREGARIMSWAGEICHDPGFCT